MLDGSENVCRLVQNQLMNLAVPQRPDINKCVFGNGVLVAAIMRWSRNNNYATPDYLYRALDHEFGFDLDPCPLQPGFDPAIHQDGLKLDWNGRRVFCNPPWSDILPWVQKSYASAALTVLLLPARTDTAWFHLLKDSGAEIRLFRRRVNFLRDGIGGNKAPTDGTMVAIVKRMNQ